MAFDTRKEMERFNSVEREPFKFIGLDGEEYELPNHGSLSPRQVERLSEGDSELAEEINLDENALNALLELPNAIGSKLAERWQEHGQGNGRATSAKTSGGGKPSKQTS